MPLTRYQIRNEYCLADPELYKAADKDDPEALLEGVAMAGLVGLLRQLGDLAEFAAEIFHDLHEDVMTTAARGHGLMARVKQLEAEFPSIEKVLLSQTNHSPFFSGTGVDWHPNLQMEQTLITRGDLPRFIMDSYEECRGPPQLFLLDKFDVAGAGACLKRYTDPSIFKVETISSGISTVEMQREKKIRKAKKKGSRWRNGETPEVVPSHAKLHELFLEERVDNGHSDPARRVTLKRRLLNGSTFDLKPGKSYMEKFVVTPSPERKQVCEVSVTQSPLTLTLDDSSESGFDIHEVSVLSPVKRSSQGEESTSSSPSVREVVLKPLTDEWNGKAIDKGIIKVLDPIADREIDESSCTIHKKSIEEELSVDTDGKQEVSLDGNHSDDMTSEVENYMDALTTMDSEMDTDNEHKPKGFMKVRKHREDSDSNEEQLDVQDKFSDSQSISNSSLSEGGNSFFKKGRSSFSYSDSLSNMAEKALSDGEGAAKAYASAGDYATKDVDLPPSDHGSVNVESARTESHQLVVVNDTLTEEDIIPDPRKASCSSCITDSNPMLLPTIPVADSLVVLSEGTELDEASSGCNKLGSESLSPVKTVSCQANCLVALSDNPLQMGYGASHTVPSNCHPVDEVDHEDPYVLTDELVHVSNMSGLASEMKIDDDSVAGVFQIQTDDSAEHSVEGMIAPILQAEEQFVPSALIAVESDSSVTLPPDSSDSLVKPDGLVSVVDDVIATRDSSSESSRPMVDTSETGSIKEHRLSDMKVNALQVEIELAKLGGPCSEEKMNLEEISECPDSEDKNGFMNKVDVVGGQASPFKHQSISSDQPNPDYHVNVDDAMSEVVQAEDVAASTLATSGANDADVSNVIWPSADSVCSFSRNSTDVQESLSISEDPHQRKMHFDDVIPTECITESEVQMEVKQLRDSPIDCDSNPHNPVSEDHANLKVIENVHEPSSELSNRKLESNLNGQSLYVKASDDTICSSACYFSESGNSLEHSIEVQADQISIESVHVEPEIFLEHTLDSQPYQPDRGFLHLDDTSSISTDIHSEQIQDPHHITEERCLYTSCLRDFPSLENNATGLSTDPFDSAFPSFSLLPQASHVNPEAMPPLPPLPPMEWRLGKFQLAPPDVQSDWIDHSAGVFQPMTADQNIQFDLPSSDREILHHTNPFLSLTGDSQKSQHSTTDLVENSSLAAPLLSEMPIPDNDAKCQQDDLPPDGTHSVNSFLTHTDLVENSSLAAPLLSEMPIPDNNAKCQQDDLQPHGTHSVNSFLTSPEMPDKMPPHCFLASGEEPAQCSLNPFSLEAAAPNELVPTQGLPIHPSNQSASETGLGVKVPEQSSQNSEGEQGNSSAKPAVPLTTEDEHQCHDFITSVGQTMLPLTTLALAPTYEVGKPNGNKIPRPRNPLIDAVAAHDKSKLRKVAERVQPQLGPMAEERDSLLEQIRAKSFNLKPAAVTTRPSIQGIQGPKTNLKVAAILEKANAIRQALAGSDEDDDSDSWSDT